MGISSETLKSLKRMNYSEPSEIQEKALPFALSGHDIIGQAKSGSGKTAVFGITIIEKIDNSNPNIQAIVLSPTRELALQVSEEISKIGRFKGIKALAIYGGQDIRIQFKRLKRKPKVIVCTPGRLLDHMRRGTIKLDRVKILVIDEADKMLEIGFIEDVDYILGKLPSGKQIMLFSATMPSEIIKLAKKHLRNPREIRISRDDLTVNHIHQVAYKTSKSNKFALLLRILKEHHDKKILIFTNTKRYGKVLFRRLKKMKFNAGYLSGDLSQGQREKVFFWFKKGKNNILIASDVAARGIDIIDIDLVINYDFPRFNRLYVHRIGRTGRFGRKGLAISLVTPKDTRFFEQISRKNNILIRH